LGDVITFSNYYYNWAHVAVVTDIYADGSIGYASGNDGNPSNYHLSEVLHLKLPAPAKVGQKIVGSLSGMFVRSYTTPSR